MKSNACAISKKGTHLKMILGIKMIKVPTDNNGFGGFVCQFDALENIRQKRRNNCRSQSISRAHNSSTARGAFRQEANTKK